MILAIICLGTLFLFPMWKIQLFAPQYPDGVEMHIWINKIGGENPATLQNINILNHYVGMKYIEPESIPELKYFQFVIVGVMALGLLLSIVDRPWGYLSWLILFVVLCALGLYDFYLWEYDYGHNLSDNAPIKIPGASFQPPLIGSKMILNFVTQGSFAFFGIKTLSPCCQRWGEKPVVAAMEVMLASRVESHGSKQLALKWPKCKPDGLEDVRSLALPQRVR